MRVRQRGRVSFVETRGDEVRVEGGAKGLQLGEQVSERCQRSFTDIVKFKKNGRKNRWNSAALTLF